MANKKMDKLLFKTKADAEISNRRENTLFEVEQKIDKINERIDAKNQHLEFTLHSIAGIVLSAVKRNGLDKTIQDLQKNCRLAPGSDEATYQDFLDVLNKISSQREAAAKKKKDK